MRNTQCRSSQSRQAGDRRVTRCMQTPSAWKLDDSSTSNEIVGAGLSVLCNLVLLLLSIIQRKDLLRIHSTENALASSFASVGGATYRPLDHRAVFSRLANKSRGSRGRDDSGEAPKRDTCERGNKGRDKHLQPLPNDEEWLQGFGTWQDTRRRRFLGMLPRLQPSYSGPNILAQINRSEPVFATFTNAAPVYIEQLLNWAFHLRELGLPHLVVCLDDASEDIAATNGIPWVPVANKTSSEDVRNDHATFRAMVSRKVDLARSLMETYRFQEVIWTDTDVVWLRDPRSFLASHASADIAIQTDCLSHYAEANFTGPWRHGFARCGHMPGNDFNNAFNTGMILFRDRPPTHTFLKDWLDYLLDANRMYVDLGGGNKAIVGDQLAFNTLITEQAKPWVSVAPEKDWRVVWAHKKQVKVRAH